MKEILLVLLPGMEMFPLADTIYMRLLVISRKAKNHLLRLYKLLKLLLAYAYQAVRVILSALIPRDYRPVICMGLVPFVVYIPVFLSVKISLYYPEVRYLWLMVGPNLHAIIATLIIYHYRKSRYVKMLFYMSLSWFTSIITLVVFTQNNDGIYNNYLIAGIIYMLVVLLINFVTLWKQQQRRD